MSWPLLLLSYAPQSLFARATRVYSCFLDAILAMVTDKTYQERIKCKAHCNPTTRERLTDILNRTGYEVLVMESSNLYECESRAVRWFRRQPITFRNLYGVAVPR